MTNLALHSIYLHMYHDQLIVILSVIMESDPISILFIVDEYKQSDNYLTFDLYDGDVMNTSLENLVDPTTDFESLLESITTNDRVCFIPVVRIKLTESILFWDDLEIAGNMSTLVEWDKYPVEFTIQSDFDFDIRIYS